MNGNQNIIGSLWLFRLVILYWCKRRHNYIFFSEKVILKTLSRKEIVKSRHGTYIIIIILCLLPTSSSFSFFWWCDECRPLRKCWTCLPVSYKPNKRLGRSMSTYCTITSFLGISYLKKFRSIQRNKKKLQNIVSFSYL